MGCITRHGVLIVSLLASALLGAPAYAQGKTELDARITEAEAELADKVKRCSVLTIAPYQKLVRDAYVEVQQAKTATKSGTPSNVSVEQAQADFKRAIELYHAARAAALECNPDAKLPAPHVDFDIIPPYLQDFWTYHAGILEYYEARDRCDYAAMTLARAHMGAGIARLRALILQAEASGQEPLGTDLEELKKLVESLEKRMREEFSGSNCPPAPKDHAALPVEQPVLAQSEAPLPIQARQILDAHNGLRAEYGSPPLRWDFALALDAKSYAAQRASGAADGHSDRAVRVGSRENLSMGRRGETPIQMMQLWLKERSHFKPGIFPDISTTGEWSDAGHISQMIWATTTNIGCGWVTGAMWEYLVCRYSPPGNQDGKPVLAERPSKIEAPKLAPVAPPPPPPEPLEPL